MEWTLLADADGLFNLELIGVKGVVGQELLAVGVFEENREFREFFKRAMGFFKCLEAVATYLDVMAIVRLFDELFMRALLTHSGD